MNRDTTPIRNSGEGTDPNTAKIETVFDPTPLDEGSGIPSGWTPGSIVLNQFKILKTAGSGGSGKVYHVEDLNSGIHYALKLPNIRLEAGSLRHRLFFREIRNWIDLPAHPNLAACRFFRTIEERIAIFSEFVEGRSLDELINRLMLPDLPKILGIAIQIARGLEVAHQAGVIHQDVKPGNVLVNQAGVVKITDFGLSRAIGNPEDPCRETGSRSAAVHPTVSCGVMTPSYCSIEQKERRVPDHRTDIWSYGLTILTMFTGPTWWNNGADGLEILNRYCRSAPRAPYPALPESVRDLIAKCLQPEPEARWGTMRDIRERLEELYRELTGENFRLTEWKTSDESKPLRVKRTPVLPLAYRTAADWLKKAAGLSAAAAAAIRVNSKITHKSRKSELLYELEVLEEAFRIYRMEYDKGRRHLQDDMIHLLLTTARTHSAAGNDPGALLAYDRAIDMMEQPPFFGDPPVNLGLLADAFGMKGSVLARTGDYDASMTAHDRGIELCRAIPVASDDYRRIPRLINALLGKSASCSRTGRYAEAAGIAREAARICVESRDRMKPDDFNGWMAACRNGEANALQRAGSLQPAIEGYDDAERSLEKMTRFNDTQKQEKLAILSMNRAAALVETGNFEQVSVNADRAVRLLQEHIDDLGRTEHLRDLATALQHRADAMTGMHRFSEAGSDIDRAIGILDKLYYDGGASETRFDMAKACCCKGKILAWSGSHREAVGWFDRAETFYGNPSPESTDPQILKHYARCLALRAESKRCLLSPDVGTKGDQHGEHFQSSDQHAE